MHVAAIADRRNGRLHIFDLHRLSPLHDIEVGAGAYPVDQVGSDLVYVSTRDLESVRPVQVTTGEAFDPIALPHKPRSTARDEARSLALVAGADKVQVSVIDVANGDLVQTVGSGEFDLRSDYGGSLACGHPALGPKGEIILLDRVARRIETYAIGSTERIASLNLPSSPHHIAIAEGRYFALCEGSRRSRIPPSVMELNVRPDSLEVVQHEFLPLLPKDIGTTGAHHLTIDTNRRRIYVGTATGWMYILELDGLALHYMTETGPDCGHVTLCPEVNLAVTANHSGVHMTVVDLETGRRAGNIRVSSPLRDPDAKTQGHTSFWSAQNRRLYTTAAQDGLVLEIDPVEQKITGRLIVPTADLIQGCVVNVRPASISTPPSTG